MNSIYDVKFENRAGVEVDLSQYKGKVILVVNTASKCGFTPQFEELEKLYTKYHSKGLMIIGFPSDSFKQEEKTTKKAFEFCKVNYGVTFPIMGMVKVNGKEAAPIYKELKKQKKRKFFLPNRVWWNFEKFLIDQEGNVIKRYSSQKSPMEFEDEIVKLLEQK